MLAVSLLSGCGGTDCPTTTTRNTIHTENGSYRVVCQSYQCPGFPAEIRCNIE